MISPDMAESYHSCRNGHASRGLALLPSAHRYVLISTLTGMEDDLQRQIKSAARYLRTPLVDCGKVHSDALDALSLALGKLEECPLPPNGKLHK